MDLLINAFEHAFSLIIEVAVRGAALVWGVFMGRLIGTGFYENPDWKKVVFISMLIAGLIASIGGFWNYKLENPGETAAEALYDALVVFFLVLIPLWTGCVWSIVRKRQVNDALFS